MLETIEGSMAEFLDCPAGESVEIFGFEEERAEVAISGGALQSALECARTGASIRTRTAEGRSGEAWTEDMSTAGLLRARDEALATGRYAGIPIPPFPGASGLSELVDPADRPDRQLTIDAHIDIGLRTAHQAALRPGVLPGPSVWVVSTRRQITLATSAGFVASQEYADSHLTVLLQVGDAGHDVASAFGLSRHRSAAELSGVAAIEEAVADARAIRARRPMAAGIQDMIIQPSAMAYILSHFAEFLAADLPDKGRGACYPVGSRVASGVVTFIDDPRLPDAPTWSAFDAEGSPARAKEVVTAGVVSGLLGGRAYGSGGNAFRDDHRSELECRASNGYLMATHADRESLIGLSPGAIWIQAAHGFAPLGSPMDQNLSLVFEGWQLAGGQPVQAVHGTWSSPFTDLLCRVVAVAADARFFPSAGPVAGSTTLIRDQVFEAA